MRSDRGSEGSADRELRDKGRRPEYDFRLRRAEQKTHHHVRRQSVAVCVCVRVSAALPTGTLEALINTSAPFPSLQSRGVVRPCVCVYALTSSAQVRCGCRTSSDLFAVLHNTHRASSSYNKCT